MRAMRKDRTRRYRSASELADDIQNYLTGTPLIAGPESTIYRARKFVRKHAGSVATAALVAVVIILGLVASIVMGCRAEQARQQETAARKQVEQALVRAEQAERLAEQRRAEADKARKITEVARISEAQQHQIAEQQAEALRRALYVSHFSMAKEAYSQRNIRRVRELLESCPADLRGWEWYRLRHIADQSHMTLHGHDEAIWQLALSPDSNHIVSCSADGTIKVWDAATGTELMTVRGHDGEVWSIAFSPDVKRIVSGGEDKTVKV